MKELGDFVLPKDWVKDPARFAVSTMLIPTFAPTSKVQNCQLLEVKRLDAPTLGNVQGIWPDTATALEEAFRAVGVDLHNHQLPGIGLGLGAAVELYDLVVHHDLLLSFLKQFRDVANSSRSCYQSVIEAPGEVTGFRGGGVLPGEYALSILPCDSHPIASDLGLKGYPVPVRKAFYVDVDFVMKNGLEIWRAP